MCFNELSPLAMEWEATFFRHDSLPPVSPLFGMVWACQPVSYFCKFPHTEGVFPVCLFGSRCALLGFAFQGDQYVFRLKMLVL